MPVAVTNSLPTNGALAPDDLEAAVARLERSARTAWADQFRGWRWSAFVRLSWSWEVDEVRAADDLRSWAARLRSQVPGIVIMVGQHPDGLTHRRHAQFGDCFSDSSIAVRNLKRQGLQLRQGKSRGSHQRTSGVSQ